LDVFPDSAPSNHADAFATNAKLSGDLSVKQTTRTNHLFNLHDIVLF